MPSPTFSVALPVPTSTNALHRNAGKGRKRRTDDYNNWRHLAGFAINKKVREAGKPRPVTAPLIIIEVDKPREDRDIDNCVKAICDILVEHKVIPDDRNMPAVMACWAMKAKDCVARVAVYDAVDAPALRFVPDRVTMGRTGHWTVVAHDQPPVDFSVPETKDERLERIDHEIARRAQIMAKIAGRVEAAHNENEEAA